MLRLFGNHLQDGFVRIRWAEKSPTLPNVMNIFLLFFCQFDCDTLFILEHLLSLPVVIVIVVVGVVVIVHSCHFTWIRGMVYRSLKFWYFIVFCSSCYCTPKKELKFSTGHHFRYVYVSVKYSNWIFFISFYWKAMQIQLMASRARAKWKRYSVGLAFSTHHRTGTRMTTITMKWLFQYSVELIANDHRYHHHRK